MNPRGPSVLLVNPWIEDFAAHDFFAAPLGLLTLAGFLRDRGFEVSLIDCLAAPLVHTRGYGTGRYPKEFLPTPRVLAGIPRRYGRYGISPAAFRQQLARLRPPGAVLVTSLMTYWYPGVVAAIGMIREAFPQTPVLLGGIYATLCPEHARRVSGADLVVTGPGEAAVLARLTDITGFSPQGANDGLSDPRPYPALDMLPRLTFMPLLTSGGCPFRCDYCASGLLSPPYHRRPPQEVLAEMLHWQARLGLTEVAFYDDALLWQAESHLLIILEELARRGKRFRFHTPNAVHARGLSQDVAGWLKRANFATLRLGVETTAPGEERLDHKLAAGEWEETLARLREAGYGPGEVGVYLLMGLPGQGDDEVAASVRRVRELGGKPILTQYSPIPGTKLWPQAVAASRYDLAGDPLFHNNSIFPCWPEFSWERFTRLKRLCEG